MGEVELKKEIENLISYVKYESNPLIVANKLSYFLSDALREDKLNLYEAFMINWEEIRFRRIGYTKSAWNGKVRIATCLTILNQKLLANVFDEQIGAEELKVWGLEAYNFNDEKRTHYIMDRYNLFLDANDSPILLEELLKAREEYSERGNDNGPYHTEVFPYDFYKPEEILLKKGQNEYIKNLDESIEDLIVELNMK